VGVDVGLDHPIDPDPVTADLRGEVGEHGGGGDDLQRGVADARTGAVATSDREQQGEGQQPESEMRSAHVRPILIVVILRMILQTPIN
jgi:hypothetical protein